MPMDFQKYNDFVDGRLSGESINLNDLLNRMSNLERTDHNIPKLVAAAFGISSEAGEFSDIVKKVVFQRKDLDDRTISDMKSELGDVLFYWMCACSAIGIDPNKVMIDNIEKLTKRYPQGFRPAAKE